MGLFFRRFFPVNKKDNDKGSKSMSHHHDHDHHHHSSKGLKMTIILTFIFFLIEVMVGMYSNSLALLSDAGHMSHDLLALIVSLLALKFFTATDRFKTGAIWVNIATLFGVGFWIFYEAFLRLSHLPNVNGVAVIWVGSFGLLINLVSLYWMRTYEDVKHDMNLKSAYAHILSDAIGSLGAIASGICIAYFQWQFADVIISFLSGALILKIAVRLLKDMIKKKKTA
jgi:cobalt-zinc-cadmium efflux system protein